MGRGDGADRSFQHRAAVQLNVGRVGNGSHALSGLEATGLLGLDGEHVGTSDPRQRKCSFRSHQRFVGHHCDREFAGEPGQCVDAGYRLLDQLAAGVHQASQSVLGLQLAPGHVYVNAHGGQVAQRLLDGGDVRHVFAHRATTNLELEDLVPTQLQHALCLVNVATGIARSQRPRNRQPVAQPPAEQLRHRKARAMAQRIEQGGLDSTLGEAVVAKCCMQPVHQRGHAVSVRADELGGKVGVDGQLHPLWRLRAVGQASDGRALADAHGAVRAANANEHQRLAVHDGHRQFVRTDRRQIDQHRLDTFDDGSADNELLTGSLLHVLYWTTAIVFQPTPNSSDAIPIRYHVSIFL